MSSIDSADTSAGMETNAAGPTPPLPVGSDRPGVALYLDLMRRCLTNFVYASAEPDFDGEKRAVGLEYPASPIAHTMIGLKRLENIQYCVEDALANNVPGDLIETGVWRGGAVIYMRAVLKAYDVRDRTVWVADSFEGLPPPRPDDFPQDTGDVLYTMDWLRISEQQVANNFAAYGLMDEQVRMLKGWFRDTLPAAPIERLAVLRLDRDMYESTMDALTALYPKVSVGGYVIVDDYGAITACREAVHDYRAAHGVTDEIHPVDWTGVYWRRSA
jgi:hypothetical protein